MRDRELKIDIGYIYDASKKYIYERKKLYMRQKILYMTLPKKIYMNEKIKYELKNIIYGQNKLYTNEYYI